MLHTEVDIDSWADMNTSSLIAADERIGENNINYISHSQRPWSRSVQQLELTPHCNQHAICRAWPGWLVFVQPPMHCHTANWSPGVLWSLWNLCWASHRTPWWIATHSAVQTTDGWTGSLGYSVGIALQGRRCCSFGKAAQAWFCFLGCWPTHVLWDRTRSVRDGPFDGVQALFTMELASTSAPPLSVSRWFAWEHWAGSCLCAAAQLGCQVT